MILHPIGPRRSACRTFPNAKEIAIDTENKDPNLKTKGPGFIRKDGYIAGIGIATDSGFRGYYPIAHAGGGNLDAVIVRNWMRETCSLQDRDYVFANAQYDLGWLRASGVEVKGRIHDISIADTLIDEERSDGYSLESLSKRWLGVGKDEILLREAARNWGVDPKADLWKLPANLVGAYGETDPVRTLQVHQKQIPVLRAQGLWPVYQMECQLTPVLFEMFWRGIRVDVPYAEALNQRWLTREQELLKGLSMNVDDIWNARSIGRLCDREGIRYSRTKTGEPSITKAFFKTSNHPKIKFIEEVRALNRTRSIYLEQNLIKELHRGRVHPQYIQMHCDDGGTRTMRLSCRNPNIQQIPKRSTLFDAKSIRKVLIPEEGMLWAKQDYWSQEPVIQNHYAQLANLPGAKEVAEEFKKGVKLANYIEKASNGACSYDQAKVVTLARTYGQMDKFAARDMGIEVEEFLKIVDGFDKAVPYISILVEQVTARAQQKGLIRTLAGHHRHFNYWEVPYKFRDLNDKSRRLAA